MRTTTFLKQVTHLVLVTLFFNTTLPSIHALAADPEKPWSQIGALVQEQVDQDSEAARVKKEWTKVRDDLQNMKDASLVAVLPAMAESTIALLRDSQQAMYSDNTESPYRGGSEETVGRPVKNKKNLQRKNLINNLTIAAKAPSAFHAHATTHTTAEEKVDPAEVTTIKKSQIRARIFAVVFFLMSIVPGWGAYHYFYVVRGLILLLNRDGSSQANPDRMVQWSRNPSQINWLVNSGSEKDPVAERLRSNKLVEETVRENLMPPNDTWDYSQVSKNMESIDSKALNSVLGTVGLSVSALGLLVASFAMLNGLLGKKKKLAELSEKTDQYNKAQLEIEELNRNAKLRVQELEEIYEKHYWSKLREVFPDLPVGHAAALAWLEAKVAELSKLLLATNVRVAVNTPCGGPLSDAEFSESTDSKAEAEARADAENIEAAKTLIRK